MDPRQGSALGIEIDTLLVGHDSAPSLFTGHDLCGHTYLVAEVGRNARSVTWLCAPMSPLALRCVVEGRADPFDALRHSATGAVDRVTIATDDAHPLEETVQLCRDLGDELVRSQEAMARCA